MGAPLAANSEARVHMTAAVDHARLPPAKSAFPGPASAAIRTETSGCASATVANVADPKPPAHDPVAVVNAGGSAEPIAAAASTSNTASASASAVRIGWSTDTPQGWTTAHTVG